MYTKLVISFVLLVQTIFVCSQENFADQVGKLRQEVEQDFKIEVLKGKLGEIVDILILVRSQPGEHHGERLESLLSDIKCQIEEEEIGFTIGLTRLHQAEFPGSWTLFPTFYRISKAKWIIVCEDSTQLNLTNIALFLTEKDYNSLQYFGRCLRDKKPVITHHFGPKTTDFNTFDYPLFASGTIYSISLIKLFNTIELDKIDYFTIDIQHEIALYIFDNFQVRMTCDEKFCIEKGEKCLTSVKLNMNKGCRKTRKFDLRDLTIAVKTYDKNYLKRIPLIIDTWLPDLPKTRFFTHAKKGAAQPSTMIDLIDVGFNNTGGGHCEKVQYIIKYFFYYEQSYWLGILDDDSFINIQRLSKILSCHDPNWEAIILGERYGFLQSRGYGYPYITGGGGIFMSRKAVEKFMQVAPKCSQGTADDMWLGMFGDPNGVKFLDYPNFHQTVSGDYHEDYIKSFMPVSYHRLKSVREYETSLKG